MKFYQNIVYILIAFYIIFLIREGYWSRFWRKFFDFFKRHNLKYFFLVIFFLILIILFIDKPVYLFFQNKFPSFLDKLIVFSNNLGNGKKLFPLLFLIYFIFYSLKKYKISNIFSFALFNGLLAGFIGQLIKYIFMRARPYINVNPFMFFSHYSAIFYKKFGSIDFKSFPSGHTIITFAVATTFYFFIKIKYLRFLVFIFPFFTAMARIYLGKHWPSDVFLGSILGIYIAYISYKENFYKN